LVEMREVQVHLVGKGAVDQVGMREGAGMEAG
jgi:hypothetical protein